MDDFWQQILEKIVFWFSKAIDWFKAVYIYKTEVRA